MSFWIWAAILATISAVGVLWPLRRKANAAVLDRQSSAMEIFRDQLEEVDRDEARGLITGIEALSAKAEIKRRMLATARDGKDVAEMQGSSGGLLIVLAALLPIFGAVLYTQIGAPEVPSIPFAEREEERQGDSELNALIAELRSKLEADPAGGETRGWLLLADTLMNRGRYMEAANAYSRVVERDDASSGTWSQYAEALIAAENGVVTPAAERAIERALQMDPMNPAGTYFRAQMLDQAGQTVDARVLLLERIAAETQYMPWMDIFLEAVNRMGAEFGLEPETLPEFPDTAPARGPSAADIEAAQEMTPEEQQEFIRSMVTRLAERLQDDPSDLQGWLQLARAHAVLGERDKALEALQSAQPLIADLPENNPMRRAVEQGLQELGG